MLFRLVLSLKRTARQMWVRSALFCVLAIGTAFLSLALAPAIPESVARTIGADSVDAVLTVIASSMLAVATFSLATMVSAYASASTTATPRAVMLLIEDSAAQNALATFIGAFIFSLVGIILLSTGIYDAGGRLVLLGVTILIVAAVVAVMIRWIDQLARLGRVHETIDRVEEAAIDALKAELSEPRHGAMPRRDDSTATFEVVHDEVGYVQEIDAAALDALAEQSGAAIHLLVRPGAFVHRSRPVLRTAAPLDDEQIAVARSAVVVGSDRAYDHDARFGVIALSEIASRALSPAVNDPGTAIDVLNTLVRVMSVWDNDEPPPEPVYRRVHAPDLSPGELVKSAFIPIARDGAGMVEVCVTLQKAFAALAASRNPELAAAARETAATALRRAERALDDEDDLAFLRGVARGESSATGCS